ncbi:MAG: helix-turn-helix transcriptional regulator [Bacteroidia bacterium]
MSDQALAGVIGEYVKHHRLEQNKTQQDISHAAGISRSTLSLLEKGETVTVATLIQVLRVLNLLQVMDVFVVKKEISPIALAKIEQEQRLRAGKKKSDSSKKSDW